VDGEEGFTEKLPLVLPQQEFSTNWFTKRYKSQAISNVGDKRGEAIIP